MKLSHFSVRVSQDRGETSQYPDFAGHAREKLHKERPLLIDLTKPQQCRSLPGKHVEVCRDREVEPHTASKFLMLR
jgi:hypothetical protein